MNHEQEWEGSRTMRETQLRELLRILAVLDAFVENWRRPF